MNSGCSSEDEFHRFWISAEISHFQKESHVRRWVHVCIYYSTKLIWDSLKCYCFSIIRSIWTCPHVWFIKMLTTVKLPESHLWHQHFKHLQVSDQLGVTAPSSYWKVPPSRVFQLLVHQFCSQSRSAGHIENLSVSTTSTEVIVQKIYGQLWCSVLHCLWILST